MKLSIIDIGTQSLKHYIFEQGIQGKKLIYYKRHSDANLGESDILSEETIKRNIQILKNCLALNKSENVSKVHLVGTEILRKAKNASEFTSAVRQITGQDIEVITHDKEALYLYEGFLDIVSSGTIFGAVNIGGGSTELIIGTKERLINSVKLPFGAKFIRKTFGEHDKIKWQELEEYLDKQIQLADQCPQIFITGVLDFVTTVRPYIPFNSRPHHLLDHPIMLSMEDWRKWILKMRTIPIEKQKRYYAKDPNFCDGTTIGHSVYYAIAKKLGVRKVIPSNRDLTDGIIYEMNK